MAPQPVKGGVYSVVSASDTGNEGPRHRLPRWILYALIGGGITLVVGLVATLWVWTNYGTTGLEGHEQRQHPGTVSLVLGPVVALAGVCAMIGACAIHEARHRREARLARTRHEFFDPLATPQPV